MNSITAQAAYRKTMALVDFHMDRVRQHPQPGNNPLYGPCAYCKKDLRSVRLDHIYTTDNGLAAYSIECVKKFKHRSSPNYVIGYISALIGADPVTGAEIQKIRDMLDDYYRLQDAGQRR